MHMLMTRLFSLAIALTFSAPALAAGPSDDAPAKKRAVQEAVAFKEPAAKQRRVERLEQMKIKGRRSRPLIDVALERAKIRFEAGTIQYRHGRKSFEYYE